MKIKGFTIAEILVTLSIISVVSLLVAPVVTDLMPDKNKIKVLQYHENLTNVINDILNDDNLYHPQTAARVENNRTVYFFVNTSGEECTGLSCVEGRGFERELLDRLGVINGRINGIPHNLVATGDGGFQTFFYTNNQPYSRPYSVNLDNPRSVNLFMFGIDANGAVVPIDALSQAYLKNPHNMNDREKDFAEAKKIYNKSKIGNGNDTSGPKSLD